jgi:hypothetical protein
VTVGCLLSSEIKTNGRRLFSLIDLFPPYFIKICLNIHPKIPLKCDFSIWATPDGHPKDSIVLRRARHHLLHALLSSLIFTCKNYLDWDIFRYFYFFTKYGRRPFSFIDLFPPYFIKLCLNIHAKTPLKCHFSIWAGSNPFTFWSASFQIKLAPLILYTTLVYTSTLKSTV